MLPSLLVLTPILILIFAAVVILVLARWRPSFGYAWLIATGASLLGWIGIYLWRVRMPQEVVLVSWNLAVFPFSPALRVDAHSWPFALSLISLTAAVILTAPARFQAQASSGPAWAGSLILTSLGLTAVLADNPVTLLLAWAAIDMLEVIILLAHISGTSLSQQAVLAFATRLIGTMVVWWAFVANLGFGGGQDFDNLSPTAGLFLLLGVGLRLGVYPLHLPFRQEPPLRRGLGTVLRIIPVASSLAVLCRLPGIIAPQPWLPFLLGFSALAAVTASLLWLVSTDEIRGRPYWMISLAALSITCAVQGFPGASMAWALQLILVGGTLFLYSARNWHLIYLPLIGFLCLSGLPYTPLAGGWEGLVSRNMPALTISSIAAVAMILLGFLRHALRAADSLESAERWIKLAYQIGILVLLLTSLLLGFTGWEGSRTPGVWWASALALILCAAIGLYARFRQFMVQTVIGTRRLASARQWITNPVPRFGRSRWTDSLYSFLRLDWFYWVLSRIYHSIARLIVSLTTILEGDGGVLWTLLLMALFITLLTSQVSH